MITIRDARPDDYRHFQRMMPELGVLDPVPSFEAWWPASGARTRIAERGSEVAGYLFYEVVGPTFFVRNVVSDAAHRGRGVGRALMLDAELLARAKGAADWQLNVKDDNAPALGLYGSLGFTVIGESHVVLLPWALVGVLPGPEIDMIVRAIEAEDDRSLEQTFSLLPGLLDLRRRAKRMLLASFAGRAPTGFACFDPGYPGAYPMQARDVAAARALLEAMRAHRIEIDDPEKSWRATSVQLGMQESASAAEAMIRAGAELRFRALQMRAELRDRGAA